MFPQFCRCYCSNEPKSPTKNVMPLGGCLRSPGALIRQKSFHTLSELVKFCQNKSVRPNSKYNGSDGKSMTHIIK